METQKINVMEARERLCFDICLTTEESVALKNNIKIQEDVSFILENAPYAPVSNLTPSLSVVGYQRAYFQSPSVEEIRKYLCSYPFIREINPLVLCPVINWIQDHKDFFQNLGIEWLVVFSGKEIFGITINSAKVVTFADNTEWNEGDGLFLFERLLKPEQKFHN